MKILRILSLSALLLCLSCSPQKRCEHHTKKLKVLGCFTDHSDTIWHTDTIKGFSVDTVFKFSDTSAIDTVWIVSNGVKVQTVIKWRDKIVEQTVTKRDTVVKTMEVVKYKNFEIPVPYIPIWVKVLIGFLIVVCLALIFKK